MTGDRKEGENFPLNLTPASFTIQLHLKSIQIGIEEKEKCSIFMFEFEETFTNMKRLNVTIVKGEPEHVSTELRGGEKKGWITAKGEFSCFPRFAIIIFLTTTYCGFNLLCRKKSNHYLLSVTERVRFENGEITQRFMNRETQI